MLFEQILFFVAAAIALAGALGVVLLRNPFYSVLALVCHLVALATLFLLLNAQFVAAAQVVVYAGAVMVLYLFVVAYVGGADEPLGAERGTIAKLGVAFALALLCEVIIAVIGSGVIALDSQGARLGPGFGAPGQIGALLLRQFLFPFEVASLLLLIAAIGAVVLARRRRGLESVSDQGGVPEAATDGGGPEAAATVTDSSQATAAARPPEREAARK